MNVLKLGKIEITDGNGTNNVYSVQEGSLPNKSLIHIGNIKNVDITLTDIPPARGNWLVQLISDPCRCRLHNVGNQPIQFVSPTNALTLAPYTEQSIPYHQQIQLDDYTFVFHRDEPTSDIRVQLSFPPPVELTTDHTANNPLTGLITVYNDGSQAEVQFNLRLMGLADGTYHLVDTNPKLSYVRQEEIKLFIYHASDQLINSGPQCIQIQAQAPYEYPGQVAVDAQPIYVQPQYRHSLVFENSMT